METVHTTLSKGEHLMEMPITLEGRDIVVAASTVRFYGADHEMPEERIAIEARPEATLVRGSYVLDSEGALHLFLDEWVQDGVDEMWEPDRDSPYQPAALLLQVEVPPGSAPLDDLPLNRWRIILDPNAPKEG
ncbi:MAG: hypothetical protein AB7W59_00060 [Acidimicrobiia bacterium]